MHEIIELPPEIYNKIAAGEVIERPASVVKELIENSIDASSTSIKILIKDSGKKEITIIDNGHGIKEEFLKLAVKKHATSKIKHLDDIFRINTLGFRGEALASIASVSRLQIETKFFESEIGNKVTIQGGKTEEFGKCGISEGTKIKVENLFYNTPARLKFLKTASTEDKYIKTIITNLMLGYPAIGFELFFNNKKVLKTNPCKDRLERIKTLFGKDTENLIHIKDNGNIFKLEGYISDQNNTRPTRSYQRLFLNNRPITTRFQSAAIDRGYENLLMRGRYPTALLFLFSEPAFFDVNVHPTKKEIRFSNDNLIFSSISESIRKGLKETNAYPNIIKDFNLKQEIKFNHKEGTTRALELYLKKNRVERINDFTHPVQKHDSFPNEVENDIIADRPFKIHGQIFSSYILVEYQKEFMIIDQHASHEKIIYERLKKDFENQETPSQKLLLPFNIDLLPEEFELFRSFRKDLEKIGYEIEEFGDTTVKVNAVPSYVRRYDDKQLITDIIDLLCNKEQKYKKSQLLDEMLKLMACKSAIKAGEKQSEKEMEILVEQLFELDEHLTCPHGRPLMIKLSLKELEKTFKRK